MNRDDVIRLAKQAGIEPSFGRTANGKYRPNVNALGKTVPIEWIERLARSIEDHAAKSEREDCANVCESQQGSMSMFVHLAEAQVHGRAVLGCAAAIRQRGSAD